MISKDINIKNTRYSGVSIMFTEYSVIKRQSKYSAQLEYHRTNLGEKIGQITGLFRVPKIITFDLSSGSIEFERIYGLRSLSEVLSNYLKPENVIESAAYALASIHNNYQVENINATFIDLGCAIQADPIFVHGDYSIMNIYLDDKEDLVILDWSTASWVVGDGSVSGPCYLDLSVFVLSLFFRRPLEAYKIKNPEKLMSVFLDAYCSKYQHEFLLKEFKCYFLRLIKMFLRAPRTKRANVRVLLCLPTVFAAMKCVKRL